MSSGIYTTIKLHPFYQEVLRGMFQEPEPVFKFPHRHDLLTRLTTFLSLPPKEPIPTNFGKESFRIEIPNMEHKDPFYYNYLSKKRMSLFETRIRDYIRSIIHEDIWKYRKQGFLKEEIIYLLMEELNVSPVYFDLMLKEYQRFLSIERLRRFRKKHKKRAQNRIS